MNNEDINYKQQLKEQFFKNDSKLFSKKSKFISFNLKDTTSILSNIASKPKFGEVRKRYKLTKLISKILLKSHFHWVLYAYYRNDTLYIATLNHIGQSELNLQKLTLISYFKKTNEYKNIQKVSIFRDKDYKKIKKKTNKKDTFSEKSYGIFINNLKNKKLHTLAENIRKKINQL